MNHEPGNVQLSERQLPNFDLCHQNYAPPLKAPDSQTCALKLFQLFCLGSSQTKAMNPANWPNMCASWQLFPGGSVSLRRHAHEWWIAEQ